MGITYQKRNRLENLQGLNPIVTYGIGTTDFKFSRYDYQTVLEFQKKRLDEAQKNYGKPVNFNKRGR